MSWFHAARARARLLFARRAAESRIDEEVRFHVEMETQRLVREGIAPDEARRRALAAFGGITQHTETLREGRGLAWVEGLSLDFKLAGRMLAKYPGLTLVAIVGMAVGVAIGTVAFSSMRVVMHADLPISEGDRVIAIRNSDVRDFENGRRNQLHDFAVWREELTTVEDLGAFRMVDRNFITADGQSEPLRVAEMSAAGFRIARTAPLLGRYFHDDDERAGAPPVVVIGFDLWQRRFGARPDVIGRRVQLGDASFVVIGVMPKGFLFPVNNRVWTPFKLRATDYERGHAPGGVEVFGRLAPGARLADVNRQLATITARLAVAFPESHADIRTVAYSYTDVATQGSAQAAWLLFLLQVVIALLLVVVGTNVAILVYARTASRMGEIAVRTALGASRRRVVAQFFAEALALSAIAAVVGLVVAHFALATIESVLAEMGGEQLPFWMHFRVTPEVAVYAALLAVFSAVIVGVIPALKATSRRVSASLQRLSAGGSGIQLGRTWTLLIVGQVAISVAILPLALAGIAAWRRVEDAQSAAVMKQVLTATLFFDRGDVAQQRASANRSVLGKLSTVGRGASDSTAAEKEVTRRYLNLRADLIGRLQAEPNVTEVALSASTPGSERTTRFETEATTSTDAIDAVVGAGAIDEHFLETFNIPVLAGRGFERSDYVAPTTAVIINRSLARRLFGSTSPLGRRIRETSLNEGRRADSIPPRAWEEIVGVISDFPVDSMIAPKIYRPFLANTADPLTIAVRTRGASAVQFGSRMQQLTVTTSPMLRLASLEQLDQTVAEVTIGKRLVILVLELVTLSTVLLSAAGIYALMAFTVTRRRREIGIRAALGAGVPRMLMSIMARSAAQVAAGIVVGIAVAAVFDHLLDGGWTGRRPIVVLAAVACLMAVIGLLASLRPAHEALRIHPTEALRAE